jgi:hypothetical protein
MTKTYKEQKSQADKFREAAEELGVDLDEVKLKEALRKIAKSEKKDSGKKD